MNWMELKEDSIIAGASPKVAARARFVFHFCVQAESRTHPPPRLRLFLIAALFIALISLGMSIYIMSEVFLSNSDAYAFAGVSVFVGCLAQVIATWVMRVATIPSES